MNKSTIIGTIIAIILAIAGFFILFTDNPDSNVPQVPVPSDNLVMEACDLFTEADAKGILGTEATKVDAPESLTIGKTRVSHCTYTNTTGKASIVIRTAKSAGDAKYIFENSKRSYKGMDDEVVVGDSAYWVPSIGQYNVLKDDNWIITTYPDNKEVASQIAISVAAKL